MTAGHLKDAQAVQPLSSLRWVWRPPLRRPCHCQPRKRTCSLLRSKFCRSLAGCPIFLPDQAPDEEGSNPWRRRNRGGAASRSVPPPRRVPSGPGLHGFRFVVRAGLRGGLRTQVAATEGLCSFSLSCGWRQVEVGGNSMKELNFRSEPSSPLLPRDFLFKPSPLRRRLGEFRSTRGAEPSRA